MDKQLVRLLFCLCLAPLAWGAACTATVTGDWNSGATWGGTCVSAVVPYTYPGAGDTATINAGVTVTVPVGFTASVGTSPTNDSGTTAMTVNGPLTINGTLKWQGPVQHGNAVVTVNGGGTLTYDASGAATPASALYSWRISTASSQANSRMVWAGTSGAHVTVNSQGNYQSGGFGMTGTAWVDSGRIEATYADISYQGAATTSGSLVVARLSTAVSLIFDHCTIDHSGQIMVSTTFGATSIFRVVNSKITNPANTSYSIQTQVVPAALTSGTREISNNVIYGRVYLLATGAAATGFTIKHNVFRKASFAGSGDVFFTNGTVAAWDQNLLFFNSSQDGSAFTPLATLTNTYMFRMGNPAMSNMHPIYFMWAGAVNNVFDKWVFDYTSADQNTDLIEPNGADSASSRTTTVQNSIFLPNGGGASIGSFFNNSSGQAMAKTHLVWDHNTMYAPSLTGQVYGIGCEAAGSTMPALAVASARSNILWRSTSGQGILFSSSTGTCTPADGAITSSSHNALYNITTNPYTAGSGMSVAKFGSTPGTNDVIGDPKFVDSSRNLLKFDQGYLSAAVGTAWATSTAYAVGDIVSNSDASFYGGATYNYVCVEAHTSGATTEPGVGSGWAQYWEPASIKYIEDSVLAGTTYSGGANSIIGELVNWVRGGFAPQYVALKDAGHDGVTIGAVEGKFSGGIPATVIWGRLFSGWTGSVFLSSNGVSVLFGRERATEPLRWQATTDGKTVQHGTISE